MSFLPEGEQIPASNGKYTKFVEGENRFRVLSSAITGWELWVEGKPVRRKDKSEFTTDQLAKADINKFTGMKKVPQYFWAFLIWNYQTEQVEILEVPQVTIMRGIEDYLKDADYGNDPKEYDLIVIRDESGEKVEYRVKAKPPKAMDEGIKEFAKDMKINLNALYKGEDPFATEFEMTDEQMDEVDAMSDPLAEARKIFHK